MLANGTHKLQRHTHTHTHTYNRCVHKRRLSVSYWMAFGCSCQWLVTEDETVLFPFEFVVAFRKQKMDGNRKEATTNIKRMSNTFSVLLVTIFFCPCNHRGTPSVPFKQQQATVLLAKQLIFLHKTCRHADEQFINELQKLGDHKNVHLSSVRCSKKILHCFSFVFC